MDQKTPDSANPRASFGFAAFRDMTGGLPNPFPRVMGPNAGKYVLEVVDSGLTCNMTERFEQEFARQMGARHCVSAPGCSNALLSLAESLRFEPGDEVVFSPVTDYGTVMGFVKCGCIPVFADTAPGSINVSAETLEKCVTPRTRAVVVVHMMGLVCDMDPILDMAARRGIPVIEDACQAVFSTYKGRRAGSMGLAGAFSFDSEKTMGSDIGGCFITGDDELAEYARFYCQSRGARQKPGFGRLHVAPGSAMRMPNCTAAVNLAQLEILPENVAVRDRMIRRIYGLLKTVPGILVEEPAAQQEVFSCWMAGFRLAEGAFGCTPDEFAADCVALGFTGLGTGYYSLLPESCTFLREYAEQRKYPYCPPATDKTYAYDPADYPNARAYLRGFLRWSSFCEKYTEDDCELAYNIVREVAARRALR